MSDVTGVADGRASDDAAAVRLPPSISIEGLRAAYGRIEVLHGVDLVVPAGSVFALLGPNGAGKSTLLKVMSARLRPTAGQVRIGDDPSGGRHPSGWPETGSAPSPKDAASSPTSRFARTCASGPTAAGSRAAEVEERTFSTFPRLKERRRQMAGTLSGGEQQMLAISRAIVTRPRVLLLDELSMGLAPLVVQELYELVGQLSSEGMTIVLVEQFVTTALAVANRAAIMIHGRIDREGAPDEMADAALGAYLS